MRGGAGCPSHATGPRSPDRACPATGAGTPLKPTIRAAAGGGSLDATITYDGVFTATTYETVLTDVNVASNTDTDTMTVAVTAEGPWTRTLQAPAKGTYRFTVRCVAGWCNGAA